MFSKIYRYLAGEYSQDVNGSSNPTKLLAVVWFAIYLILAFAAMSIVPRSWGDITPLVAMVLLLVFVARKKIPKLRKWWAKTLGCHRNNK